MAFIVVVEVVVLALEVRATMRRPDGPGTASPEDDDDDAWCVRGCVGRRGTAPSSREDADDELLSMTALTVSVGCCAIAALFPAMGKE